MTDVATRPTRFEASSFRVCMTADVLAIISTFTRLTENSGSDYLLWFRLPTYFLKGSRQKGFIDTARKGNVGS